MTFVRAVTVCVLLAGLGGCAFLDVTPDGVPELVPSGGEVGKSPPFRRVVFMPIESEPADAPNAEFLRRSLEAALSRRNLFETVPVSHEDLVDIELGSTRREGTYHTDDLILASRRFGADGVLYGVMTQFAAYPTVRVGVRLYLLDCRTGRVPWATETLLDAGDRLVAQDVHNYHDIQLKKTESLLDYERILRSPRLFSGYAASRIADAMRDTLVGPVVPVEAGPTAKP